METLLYVGLDVGAATIKAGVVDDAGHPRSAVNLPTEPTRGATYGLAQMCEAVRAAADAAHAAHTLLLAGGATEAPVAVPAPNF